LERAGLRSVVQMLQQMGGALVIGQLAQDIWRPPSHFSITSTRFQIDFFVVIFVSNLFFVSTLKRPFENVVSIVGQGPIPTIVATNNNIKWQELRYFN